jgi:hypothetical protein
MDLPACLRLMLGNGGQECRCGYSVLFFLPKPKSSDDTAINNQNHKVPPHLDTQKYKYILYIS